MREIKFRGLNKDNEAWEYGGYYEDATGIYIMSNTLSIACRVKVVRSSVGQYVGVNDKNHVEIFTGDIVKAWDRGVCGIKEVKWRQEGNPCYILYPAITTMGQWGLSATYIDGEYIDDGVEVIGNIYDNPELPELLEG